MQKLSMGGTVLLWCILNVTAWASTSPQKMDPFCRSLSPEGQSIAEGSEAQGPPVAPGVLGCDAGLRLTVHP